ncbi:hypothetical protein AMECASPLE_026664 [Ameca splendens]|uniref:Uncharacterized protein n=1 Tax=Ameca splendens TaxID=208324 RepID=A0ABV0XU43_9TELE
MRSTGFETVGQKAICHCCVLSLSHIKLYLSASIEKEEAVDKNNCNGPLASALPHSSFQSSSQSSASYSAFYAKLNRRDATLCFRTLENTFCAL